MTPDINKQEAVIPQLLSKLFLIINIIETNKSARFNNVQFPSLHYFLSQALNTLTY